MAAGAFPFDGQASPTLRSLRPVIVGRAGQGAFSARQKLPPVQDLPDDFAGAAGGFLKFLQ